MTSTEPAPPPATAPPGSPILVEGLSRHFGSHKAVDGIDLSVDEGQIYGFLGPNGAGKSTTVLMLTTLLPPTSGRAFVGGHDIVRQAGKVRATIGAALQDVALDPVLNAREHMELQGALQGIPSADRTRRGDDLLGRVGLTDAAGRRVGGYSGGMKRRLDLALALIHRPSILFLDEPTTGLDPQSRSALWNEVSRLASDDGVTVFLTTQYLEEADVLADQIAIIDSGHIVARGTPAALKAEIGLPSVELVPVEATDRDKILQRLATFGPAQEGRPGSVRIQLQGGTSSLADVVRALDTSPKLGISNLELHAPTLDDVFLLKTGRTLEGASDESVAHAAPAAGRRGRHGRHGRGAAPTGPDEAGGAATTGRRRRRG